MRKNNENAERQNDKLHQLSETKSLQFENMDWTLQTS